MKMRGLVLLVVAGLLLFFSSCKWDNPMAPKDSLLYVSANPMTIKTGGATSLVTVIGYELTGVPMKERTIINFTTDFGTIDPTAEIKNGRATATFTSGSQSGEAQIYVTSGTVMGDPFPLKIAVGSLALSSLVLRADSFILSPGGGKIHLTADAFDMDGNVLSDIPVVFTTNAGILESGGKPVNTNAQGRAEDNLTTTTDAEVKAISGSVTSSSVKITVKVNKSPVARFNFSPQQPRINDPVIFDGSASSDEDGTIVDYKWSFGNGGESQGVQTSTRYPAPGTYTVTLIVTDNLGLKHSECKSITVAENKPPVARFVFSPQQPRINDTVYFDGSASSDEDGTIVGYKWSFGNGGESEGAQSTTHYHASGTYNITLIVTDNLGLRHSESKSITVAENKLPIAVFKYSPASPKITDLVYFNASESYDPDGTIVGYDWDFGDGIKGSGVQVKHQFVAAGTYWVALTVRDDSGGVKTLSDKVTVSLTAGIEGPMAVKTSREQGASRKLVP